MFTLQIDEDLALSLIGHETSQAMFDMIRRDCEFLSRWMAWPIHTNRLEDYLEHVKRVGHDYAEGRGMACCIHYRGEPVGSAGFNTIDRSLRKATIGYWLSEMHQGRGIMTRTCRKLIDIAFAEWDLDKIEIPVAVENRPSRAVCERLGMEVEGVIRNAEHLNGRIVDHAYYALYRTDG